MNRDFILKATPAVARRLLRFNQITRLDLPDGVEALAQQDRITETDFDPIICPYTPERAEITQFLLDNDMRGIVQASYHPMIDEITLLNIARISGDSKISVFSKRSIFWHKAARAWFLTDIDIRAPFDVAEQWIDQRRDGLLIIDLYDENYEYFRSVVREFPRIIVYQPKDQQLHWTFLANLLFPTMPHPQFFSDKILDDDFAVFYNVCLFPTCRTTE